MGRTSDTKGTKSRRRHNPASKHTKRSEKQPTSTEPTNPNAIYDRILSCASLEEQNKHLHFIAQDSQLEERLHNYKRKWTSKEAFLLAMVLNRRTSLEISLPKAMTTKQLLESVLSHDTDRNLKLEIERIHFLIQLLSHLDKDASLSEGIMEMMGLGLWAFVSTRRKELEFGRIPSLKKLWVEREEEESGVLEGFVPKLMDLFLEMLGKLSEEEEGGIVVVEEEEDVISSSSEDEEEDKDEEMDDESAEKAEENTSITILFLHKTLELFTDLLAQLPTRRFFHTLLLDKAFSIHCQLSPLTKHPSLNAFFSTYLQYEHFSIENYTGKMMSEREQMEALHNRVHIFQKMAFKYYPEKLRDVVFSGVGAMLSSPKFLRTELEKLSDEELYKLCHVLRLVDTSSPRSREFWMAVLVQRHTLFPSLSTKLQGLPLYPTEELLWDEHSIPPGHFVPSTLLSKFNLPKLNLQYLTMEDWLLRSFILVRYESSYEIRSDLVRVIRRLDPILRYFGEDQKTEFRGWARMGLELSNDDPSEERFLKIGPVPLGETVPSYVYGQICWDVSKLNASIRKEWDEDVKEFDNIFLIWIDASKMDTSAVSVDVPEDEDVLFPQRYGIRAVRGCMVLEVRDEDGVLLNEKTFDSDEKDEHPHKTPKGSKRFVKVAFDPAQYQRDLQTHGKNLSSDLYSKFNLVIRRHGRENNFKSILETIKNLMQNTSGIYRTLPPWLHKVVLGYGDPKTVSFSSEEMQNYARVTAGVTHPDAALDYGDTFLSQEHLVKSFPSKTLLIDGTPTSTEDKDLPRQNYSIRMPSNSNEVLAYSYPFSSHTGNPIPFTPTQVQAIRSGLSPGLSLIVGPPGTGKTDVAVQIIANLYHSFPSQRTVIVTHSNAALNDIFAKIVKRGDVPERYMLRLGSGERDLLVDSKEDFTKTGRVMHILTRRSQLLEKVQCLSESLGISTKEERGGDGSPSYTCETAALFYKHHVMKRIQLFNAQTKDNDHDIDVLSSFPFSTYFHTPPTLPLHLAKLHMKQIQRIFSELEEYRPLELLRTQRQRLDYLLTKQAKIVAMTCTHAAIARSHLASVGFQYDNAVMEEAAQMLEIETLIPLVLQKPGEYCRLKRICLIGDHFQLPPVVKNMAFSKFSHLDQSLFQRLVRLGVKTILLDKQGRARPEIADLYSWRYDNLGNLDHVHSTPAFQLANPGFAHTFQMIDVRNFQGRGETSPTPFFYQNLGEAEYTIALFQFMILIGYPPSRISILTTYNGQKELLQDILSQRCGPDTPLANIRPKAVSTVDQYQGQQNDFVLLSLVRTKSIGYMRDVRRLIVAVSRARLGLYVFCRKQLFDSCVDLKEIFERLGSKSTELQLVRAEEYSGKERKVGDVVPKENLCEINQVKELGALVYSMQNDLKDVDTDK